MTRISLLLLLSVPALAGWGILESPDENVARGNQQYQAGDYDDAAKSYESALGNGGDAAKIHYDVGAALYRQAEKLEPGNDRTKLLDRAEVEFRLGADTANTGLKSSAYHNLGNSQFVRERYRDAIESYKRALRANPKNDDARYNLELALRKLERDKPPPQGGGGGQGDQGQGNNNPDGNTQPQPNQGQPQGDPTQGQGDDPDNSRGDDPDKNQGNQNQPQGQGNDQQDKQGGADPDDPTQQPDPNNASGGQNQTPDSPDPSRADPNNTQQNQAGRNQGNSDPGSPDRRGQPNSPSQQPAPDARSESERKMDELERRSLELRKQKLKNGSHSRGNWQAKPKKDW